MAYTKTVWEDLPSEDTPIVSTALNNMEDGIEFAVTTIKPTATTNGDYKCTTTGVTLEAGQCYKMLFPAPTDGTKNARLSIDNGSNYKNILFFNSSTNVPSALLSGLNADLCYDGTNFFLKTAVSGTWTPTLSTVAGTMTFSNIVITNNHYVVENGIFHFNFDADFTTSGTKETIILFSFPFACKKSLGNVTYTFCGFNYVSSSQLLLTRMSSLADKKTGEARRYDGSVDGWGIGSNRSFNVNGQYFLA